MTDDERAALVLAGIGGGLLLGWFMFGRSKTFSVFRDDSGRIEEIRET